MISIGTESIPAYRAEPIGVLRGAIVLIHEIWGLVPHIQSVADRLAAEGYLVIAPDLFAGIGVDAEVGAELQRLTFSADEEERAAAQPLMRERLAPARSPEFGATALAALEQVVDYLAVQPGVDGRIGVMGFCFGGTYSFALAAADPRIRSAIPFYGQPPADADLARIDCPVLALYGDQDERLMLTLPDVEASLTAAGVEYETRVYEGAGHAFFNDSNSVTYQEAAARDAWTLVLAFLRETLAPYVSSPA